MRYVAQALATAGALALLPICLTYGSLPVDRVATPQAAVATIDAAPGAREALSNGVRLPADAVVMGAPATSEHQGDLHQSQVEVRLLSTAAPVALTALSGELTRLGWEVRRGSADVFAVRRSGDRWELFQARVDTGHSPSFHGTVLVVGTGSRPA
jgi:hypothetical protein